MQTQQWNPNNGAHVKCCIFWRGVSISLVHLIQLIQLLVRAGSKGQQLLRRHAVDIRSPMNQIVDIWRYFTIGQARTGLKPLQKESTVSGNWRSQSKKVFCTHFWFAFLSISVFSERVNPVYIEPEISANNTWYGSSSWLATWLFACSGLSLHSPRLLVLLPAPSPDFTLLEPLPLALETLFSLHFIPMRRNSLSLSTHIICQHAARPKRRESLSVEKVSLPGGLHGRPAAARLAGALSRGKVMKMHMETPMYSYGPWIGHRSFSWNFHWYIGIGI